MKKNKSRIGFCLTVLTILLCFTSCSKDDDNTVAVTGVSLNKTETQLEVGEKITLVVTFTPEDATNKTVSWSSDTPAVATVDSQTGEITGVAPGKAVITVTTEDGGKTATCNITIPEEPVFRISPNVSEIEFTADGTKAIIKAVPAGSTAVVGDELEIESGYPVLSLIFNIRGVSVTLGGEYGKWLDPGLGGFLPGGKCLFTATANETTNPRGPATLTFTAPEQQNIVVTITQEAGADPIWDGVSSKVPADYVDGTPGQVRITSAAELAWLSAQSSGKGNVKDPSFRDYTFILTRDIDLNNKKMDTHSQLQLPDSRLFHRQL